MYNFRFTFIITLGFILLFSSYTSAEANEAPDEKVIKTYEEDVTGDGHKETILLYGTPLSNDSKYYNSIWATITFPDQSKAEISYKGGYQPELTFADMNQNSVNDIIFSTIIDQQNEFRKYYLHTIKRREPSEISLPAQKYLKGIYQDQYKVELQISPIDDPKIVNVESKAKQYINSGIYNEDGRLLQSISVHPQQFIEYEPVFLSSSKGYGLKSHQQINGINKADKLGEVETLWYYEGGKWIILHSKWKSTTKN